MDYDEEQKNEIEALESIYSNELQILSTDPRPCFQLEVQSQCTNDNCENVSCVIQFTYLNKYPDVIPAMEIVSSENMEDDTIAEVTAFMTQLAEENVGTVMVFTIISGVQEKLTQIVESVEERRIAEKERLVREIEEAEQKRFEGTRVTIESFLVWKTKFDTELAEIRRQKFGKEDASGPKKLSGKELFMLDHTLDDSDVKFLEEGGEVVEVDESLFQDIDELDLEADDLDPDNATLSLGDS
jgi:hypothetical protein